MPIAKARLHLDLRKTLKKRIEEIADAEHRSTNAQVEHFLELGVRAYAGPMRNRQSDEALGDSEQEGLAK